MLFLEAADKEAYVDQIDQLLRRELPPEVHGYPTHFEHHEDGTRVMRAQDGPINHGVTFPTVQRLCSRVLNIDPDQDLSPVDWVTIPEQILRAVTGGRVFHDGLGQLEPLRAKLGTYPPDVWRYLLANQWVRISQEEAFVGRCAQVGDELGSRLVAARLVRDLMRLCFLIERQYAPYIKWFGTAFAELTCAEQLSPVLARVLGATSWPEREAQLTLAYEQVARMHNALEITDPLPTQVRPFHNRPFLIIHAEDFVAAILDTIADPDVRAWPSHLGAIDQFVDSTDVLDNPTRFKQFKLMYRQLDDGR
jgi:hypothetical protein